VLSVTKKNGPERDKPIRNIKCYSILAKCPTCVNLRARLDIQSIYDTGMKTKIARWGNCLALRIPSRLAMSHQLNEGSGVEIIEDNGELRLRPLISENLKLGDLLAGITEDNLHGEIETGTVEGKESW
jgi:antitoxin MazE